MSGHTVAVAGTFGFVATLLLRWAFHWAVTPTEIVPPTPFAGDICQLPIRAAVSAAQSPPYGSTEEFGRHLAGLEVEGRWT